MFDHVTIRASDRGASEAFYDTVLAVIGLQRSGSGEHYTEWKQFSLAQTDGQNPVTRRLHIAFFAPSQELVDEFWRAGTAAGYRDDGAPGPRPQYSRDYYGGFLLDPDGNSAEAVHHGSAKEPGAIDHLWVRVADLDASRRFYETAAPYTGFRLTWTSGDPPRAGFTDHTGSFSVVHDGEPTANAHVAFAARDDTTVETFHRELTAVGYRDNGLPGERTHYHDGYYAGFVYDPDGNNIELVNHNRG